MITRTEQSRGGIELRRARAEGQRITWDNFGISSFPWPEKVDGLITDDMKVKLALNGWYC